MEILIFFFLSITSALELHKGLYSHYIRLGNKSVSVSTLGKTACSESLIRCGIGGNTRACHVGSRLV